MVVHICTKFHENILNGIRVMEGTRKVNGRTDGQIKIGKRHVFESCLEKLMKFSKTF